MGQALYITTIISIFGQIIHITLCELYHKKIQVSIKQYHRQSSLVPHQR
jgi:hypothetical protein